MKCKDRSLSGNLLQLHKRQHVLHQSFSWFSPSRGHLLPSQAVKTVKAGNGVLGRQSQSHLNPRLVTLNCDLAILAVLCSRVGVTIPLLFLLSVRMQRSCWAGETQTQGYQWPAEDRDGRVLGFLGKVLQGWRQGGLLLRRGNKALCILLYSVSILVHLVRLGLRGSHAE